MITDGLWLNTPVKVHHDRECQGHRLYRLMDLIGDEIVPSGYLRCHECEGIAEEE